jgi:hypothetical protein
MTLGWALAGAALYALIAMAAVVSLGVVTIVGSTEARDAAAPGRGRQRIVNESSRYWMRACCKTDTTTRRS